jgi:DNA-binding NarL/FixJ family response regulator
MNSVNPSPSAAEAPLRVFIVEDSPIVRARIEEMIAEIPGTLQAGHASAAEEAIRAILDAHPHIVLLDMQLEQGSGLDVLRAVHPRLPEVVFYMLSNLSAQAYRRVALELGASSYFDKTYQFSELREAIAALVHQTVH